KRQQRTTTRFPYTTLFRSRSGNTSMMAPGYEQGFGLVHDVAIDQHLLTRKRENDLVAVIAAHPKLLGIGIDEGTAVVIQGDALEDRKSTRLNSSHRTIS